MPASYNKVILMGNLTRDPEIKYLPKGTAVAEIGLAVNRQYSTDSGEKREEVTFIDITLFGRTAEIVGQYCKKGRPLLVEGRLQLDSWDDKQTGQKRSKLKVVGENIQLLGGRESGGDGGGEERDSRPASAPVRRPSAPPPRSQDPDLDQDTDDIPFRASLARFLTWLGFTPRPVLCE
jgi:single-strand DNA-binding protein